MADPVAPTWRKPFGALFILALIALWAVLVVSLSHVVGGWPIWGQTLFYVGTGMIWITPLKPLLRWMETGRFR